MTQSTHQHRIVMIKKPFTRPITLFLLLTAMNMSATHTFGQALYSFTMKTIDGEQRPLSDYRGNLLLIVNVASQCGYTPQYKDLEKLYKQYQKKGLKILAFPANNFGGQEPGTDKEIKEFCEKNYAVTFDVFSKISVLGGDQHPLYTYLTSDKGGFAGDVKWNFEKFLVGRTGTLVARYRSGIEPRDPGLVKTLERELGRQ